MAEHSHAIEDGSWLKQNDKTYTRVTLTPTVDASIFIGTFNINLQQNCKANCIFVIIVPGLKYNTVFEI